MKSDEIDKIIAEALENDRHHHAHRRRKDMKGTIRNVLNIVFIVGFIAAVIIYFAMPEQRLLFYCVGFGALLLKIIEFFIRFML